jgi:aspartyl protease family protein
MTRPQNFLTLLLLMVAVSIAAEEVQVKVIALFANKALLQVGDQQKIVAKGETFEGVLLQSASGHGAVVVVDGETLEIGLNQSIGSNYKKRERSRMTIAPDAHGMYFVDGTINGVNTGFLVDTGATHVTISGTKARALNIDFRKGVRGQAQTAAAVVPVWKIRLDSVSIGTIKLRNVTALVIEGKHPADVLLGNSFLKRTDMQKAGSMLEITQLH